MALTLWSSGLWLAGLIQRAPTSPYYYGVTPIPEGVFGMLAGVWQRWDVIHYTRIATSGYSAPDLSAFHPLFPLLSGAVAKLLHIEPLLALMLVANLALAVSLVLLYQLVAAEFGEREARATTVALLAFPGAFFLSIGYAESLTLLLAVATLSCVRKSRWAPVLVLGMAAGLSHPTGTILVVPLLVEAHQHTRGQTFSRREAVLGSAFGPLIGTGLFMAWRTSQAFPPVAEVQRELWGVVIHWPWEGLVSIASVFRSPYFVLNGWANLLVLAAALLTGLWWLRRGWSAWTAYHFSLLLFLLSVDVIGEPLASWIRHLVVLPPLFVGLSGLLGRGWTARVALLVGVGVQLYLSALFMSWIWVA